MTVHVSSDLSRLAMTGHLSSRTVDRRIKSKSRQENKIKKQIKKTKEQRRKIKSFFSYSFDHLFRHDDNNK
jgi:hypothetical protein